MSFQSAPSTFVEPAEQTVWILLSSQWSSKRFSEVGWFVFVLSEYMSVVRGSMLQSLKLKLPLCHFWKRGWVDGSYSHPGEWVGFQLPGKVAFFFLCSITVPYVTKSDVMELTWVAGSIPKPNHVAVVPKSNQTTFKTVQNVSENVTCFCIVVIADSAVEHCTS